MLAVEVWERDHVASGHRKLSLNADLAQVNYLTGNSLVRVRRHCNAMLYATHYMNHARSPPSTSTYVCIILLALFQARFSSAMSWSQWTSTSTTARVTSARTDMRTTARRSRRTRVSAHSTVSSSNGETPNQSVVRHLVLFVYVLLIRCSVVVVVKSSSFYFVLNI